MKDSYRPDGKWEFNSDVAKVFDDMLFRSIPDYTNMRDLVHRVGCEYIQKNTSIVDIGCSRGNAISRFLTPYSKTNTLMGIDVSQPMLDEIKKSYPELWNLVDFRNIDLRYDFPKYEASLTLSVLTLQFIPIEYRQKIVKNIYKNTTKGGAFIFVEKVLGDTSEIDEVLVNQYYKLKEKNGYSKDDIKTKRKSLEGSLVPLTSKWNVDLLKNAGFKQVDCFWRYLNFAGWVAIK